MAPAGAQADPRGAPRNTEGDRALKWDANKGERNGLESRRRQLEAVQGQGEGAVGRLTDDDLDVIAGQRDQLEGKIQERYGIARDQVRKDIDEWYGSQRW